jgi:hypothetical protein
MCCFDVELSEILTAPRLWIILIGSMSKSFNSEVASSTALCASKISRGKFVGASSLNEGDSIPFAFRTSWILATDVLIVSASCWIRGVDIFAWQIITSMIKVW